MELFEKISDNYSQASHRVWSWHRYSNILMKIIYLPWVIFASIVLNIIAFIFGLGILLDRLSLWLQSKRYKLLDQLDDSIHDIYWKKSGYISSPISATLLIPFALLFGIFPKWSSTVSEAAISTDTQHGFFVDVSQKYFSLVVSMLKNIFKHGIFVSLISIPSAIIFAPFFAGVALFFSLLIILDLFSWLIEIIREFVINSSEFLAHNTSRNMFNVVVMPLLLVGLFPIYIFLLLIPKISTQNNS